jgi:hypothetical protein
MQEVGPPSSCRRLCNELGMAAPSFPKGLSLVVIGYM